MNIKYSLLITSPSKVIQIWCIICSTVSIDIFSLNLHYSWIPYLWVCPLFVTPKLIPLTFHTCRHAQNLKNWVAQCPSSQLKSNKTMFCFSSQAVNRCPFWDTLSAAFFALLVIWLFIMAPKHSAEVLANVPKQKCALWINTCVRQAPFGHEL